GRHLEWRGDGIFGDTRDGERQQVEIKRVAMIVRRALAVAAVPTHLTRDFGHQDPAAQPLAMRAPGERRDRTPADVEGKRLAEQVRVRAEVVREVVLDLSQLSIERKQEIDDPWRSIVAIRIREEVERPDPGQRPDAELEHARPVDAGERR